MHLTSLDWIAIAGYLVITLLLGLYFRRKSGKVWYFVAGRQVGWWLAGTSMVPPFARTPLVVWACTLGCSRELVMVELPSFRHDDRLSVFRLAALSLITDVQFAEPISGQARRLCVALFRLSRPADELPDPGMGHQSHGQHHQYVHGYQRCQALAICVFFLIRYRSLRFLGRFVGLLWTDLFSSSSNGHRHGCCLVRRARGWRHVAALEKLAAMHERRSARQ